MRDVSTRPRGTLPVLLLNLGLLSRLLIREALRELAAEEARELIVELALEEARLVMVELARLL